MKLFLGLLIFIGSITSSFSEIKISAELDDFMELKPIPLELFHNNGYIGWIGINYPGDDWLIINREIYQHNNEVLTRRMKEGSIAIRFVFDPLQKALQVSDNLNVPPTFTRQYDQKDELLHLSDYLKSNESFLKFNQNFLSKETSSNTKNFFACRDYLNSNCLTEMFGNKSYLYDVINSNAKMLARFRELLMKSDYNHRITYNDFNAAASLRSSMSATLIYELNISDGIMDIMHNQIDEGLDKLVLARKFIDIHYAENSLSAPSRLFVGITYIQFLDQAMDALLNSGLLNDYLSDERLEMIVQPYTQRMGYKLNQSIIELMKRSFKSISYPYVKVYTTAPENIQLSEEDEYIILLYLQEQRVILPPALVNLSQVFRLKSFSSNWLEVQEISNLVRMVSTTQVIKIDGSINNNDINIDDSINFSNVALEEWYVNFFNRIGLSPKEAISYMNTKYSSNVFFNSYYDFLQKLSIKNEENVQLTSVVIDSLFDTNIDFITQLIPYLEFDQFWRRLYEQQNYHQLVYLKYLIMKNNIDSSKIPDFLLSMKNLAKNTITQADYNYDPDKKLLSTPLPKENKYFPSNIKKAYFDNKSIRNFQVVLP